MVTPTRHEGLLGRERTIPPQLPRLVPPEWATSPRIAALAEALVAGAPHAVTEFWQTVTAEGTPLIEAIDGDSTHRIVTFLWRGGDDLRGVLLLANKFTDPSILDASLLEHLPGTDIWHRSYRVRADWRASYHLTPLPNAASDRATPSPHGVAWGAIQAATPVATREARTLWQRFARFATADPLNPVRFAPNPKKVATGQPAFLSVVELPDAPPQPW